MLASYVDKTIIIPLSYGEDVDWLRNVLAQGGCGIVRSNQRMMAKGPEVVDATVAQVPPQTWFRLWVEFREQQVIIGVGDQLPLNFQKRTYAFQQPGAQTLN